MATNEADNKALDDALIQVCLRNEFYKKKFHWAVGIYVLSLVVIAFLAGVLIFLTKNPVHPLYFVTDKVGRLIVDTPRTSPNMSTDDVSDWTVEAIESAFSYDFVNYRAELQNAQKYFTNYGWNNYMDSLQAMNVLLALTERNLVVVAKVVAKPKLQVQGILGGAYAWKFQVPLLVTYYNPPYNEKSKYQNPLMVTVVVQRQSILTSYKGLGILQVIANLVLAPATSNLNAPP